MKTRQHEEKSLKINEYKLVETTHFRVNSGMEYSSVKKQAKEIIVDLLANGEMSKMKIIEQVLHHNPSLNKKDVIKALSELKGNHRTQSDGSTYSLTSSERKAVASSLTFAEISHRQSPPDVSGAEERSIDEILPFAEILRQKAALHATTTKQQEDNRVQDNNKFDGIDDDIRRLEEELAGGVDSDDDESDSEDDSNMRRVSFGPTTVKEIESRRPESDCIAPGDVLCLSTVAEDRIAPLPANLLPLQTKKRTLKGIDKDNIEEPRKKARHMVSNGLKDAVKELLEGYVARSSERLPFYCRVCAKQYDNEDDFFGHKKGDFHKAAVDMEERISYCKLCRKQFTSPIQLKEHLKSRPHKQQLDRAREGQRGQKGRGGRGNGQHAGRSERQWC